MRPCPARQGAPCLGRSDRDPGDRRGQGREKSEEMALAAAKGIARLPGTVVPAVGSDGTNGPTDAAGDIVDGDSAHCLAEAGVDPEKALADNDSYHALAACEGLVVTGPSGTNVNDLAILLCR